MFPADLVVLLVFRIFWPHSLSLLYILCMKGFVVSGRGLQLVIAGWLIYAGSDPGFRSLLLVRWVWILKLGYILVLPFPVSPLYFTDTWLQWFEASGELFHYKIHFGFMIIWEWFVLCCCMLHLGMLFRPPNSCYGLSDQAWLELLDLLWVWGISLLPNLFVQRGCMGCDCGVAADNVSLG